MIRFKKKVSVDCKEEQEDAENDTDEEDMDDFSIDDERNCHWRMVFYKNYVGVDDNKALLHAKR